MNYKLLKKNDDKNENDENEENKDKKKILDKFYDKLAQIWSSPYFILHICRILAIIWLYYFRNFYSIGVFIWLFFSFLFYKFSYRIHDTIIHPFGYIVNRKIEIYTL